MELWIRSQDKTRLTKVEDLYLVYDENNFCDYIGNNIVGHLAKYTKKGRALEVLDEIEEILMPKIKVVHNKVERKDLDGFRAEYIMQPMIEDVQVLEASSYVYKMPKE